MTLFLTFISLFPVFLIGLYIYTKDKNKEPFRLLFRLFRYGILSCFITIIVTDILSIFFPIILEDTSNLNYIELFYYVFFGIALIEELSKWLMIYLVTYKNKYFDETYDMIVYSAFVSLGFAAFENLLYVYQNGISTGILRALTAIPGHTCYGVMMGYYLSKSKIDILNNNKKSYKQNILLSIIIPTLIHGVYDYCLFSSNIYLLLFFILFLILMYVITILKVRKMSKTIKSFYKINYCSNCGNNVKDYNYCIYCGNKIK